MSLTIAFNAMKNDKFYYQVRNETKIFKIQIKVNNFVICWVKKNRKNCFAEENCRENCDKWRVLITQCKQIIFLRDLPKLFLDCFFHLVTVC